MEPEGTLPCSQMPATGSYPESSSICLYARKESLVFPHECQNCKKKRINMTSISRMRLSDVTKTTQAAVEAKKSPVCLRRQLRLTTRFNRPHEEGNRAPHISAETTEGS